MKYHEHEYQTYFFLCDAKASPLWNGAIWEKISPLLSGLSSLARGKVAVRSAQYESDHKTQSRFGRLSLSEKSNEKWNHEEKDQRYHVSTEVWAPSWSQCERDKVPPDIFFSFHNRISPLNSRSEYSFGTVVIFAIRKDAKIQGVESFISELKYQIKPIFGGSKLRDWGLASGPNGAFTSAIQCMGVTGLLKVGDWQHKELNEGCLIESWDISV